jgi:hypothetical protein
VVVALEPRARLVAVASGLEQLLEGKVVDLPAESTAELLRAGVEQVDPLGHPAEASDAVGRS